MKTFINAIFKNSPHLNTVNQTYIQHFQDSMFYSWCSLKSSVYFMIHGFYPDIFEQNGSKTINKLNTIIQKKYIKNK